MFTGLIQSLGKIASISDLAEGKRLEIQAGFAGDLQLGESVATNGVCLTVVSRATETYCVDVMPETLRLTTLGQLRVGDPVNLERALTLADRLGGHLVQGHIDGKAQVLRREHGEKFDEVDFAVPAELAPLIAWKGSIAVDGVSLTVSRVGQEPDGTHTFGVSLIPQTLAETTLGELAVGQKVNIETDMMAKYVLRMREFAGQNESEVEAATEQEGN